MHSDRAMQPCELGFGQVEFLQAFAPVGVVAPRAQRAHVEGGRLERLHQRKVIELGIVGEGDNGAALVQFHRQHGVVGHGADHGDAGNRPFLAVFLARVAHRDLVVEPHGDLAQVARQLPRADHQHPVARAMDGDQARAIELQAVGDGGVLEPRCTARHVERARHQLAGFHGMQQGVDPAGGGERLQHQLQRAAAGQAEAVRLFRADAVFHGLGPGLVQAFAPHAVDQVVFDAAAGNRADHHAVVTQRQHRALGPGRGAPGLHHGHEQHAPLLLQPAHAGLQHFEIDAVHGALPGRCGECVGRDA
ncbi:hypothetical protein BC350_16450 [Ralstonia pseudosolanacearum]|nr:hypothetical protein BC350_16450 [Ralstonia pseudosolanacearum]